MAANTRGALKKQSSANSTEISRLRGIINRLNPDSLIIRLDELGLNTEGTVKELRDRLLRGELYNQGHRVTWFTGDQRGDTIPLTTKALQMEESVEKVPVKKIPGKRGRKPKQQMGQQPPMTSGEETDEIEFLQENAPTMETNFERMESGSQAEEVHVSAPTVTLTTSAPPITTYSNPSITATQMLTYPITAQITVPPQMMSFPQSVYTQSKQPFRLSLSTQMMQATYGLYPAPQVSPTSEVRNIYDLPRGPPSLSPQMATQNLNAAMDRDVELAMRLRALQIPQPIPTTGNASGVVGAPPGFNVILTPNVPITTQSAPLLPYATTQQTGVGQQKLVSQCDATTQTDSESDNSEDDRLDALEEYYNSLNSTTLSQQTQRQAKNADTPRRDTLLPPGRLGFEPSPRNSTRIEPMENDVLPVYPNQRAVNKNDLTLQQKRARFSQTNKSLAWDYTDDPQCKWDKQMEQAQRQDETMRSMTRNYGRQVQQQNVENGPRNNETEKAVRNRRVDDNANRHKEPRDDRRERNGDIELRERRKNEQRKEERQRSEKYARKQDDRRESNPTREHKYGSNNTQKQNQPQVGGASSRNDYDRYCRDDRRGNGRVDRVSDDYDQYRREDHRHNRRNDFRSNRERARDDDRIYDEREDDDSRDRESDRCNRNDVESEYERCSSYSDSRSYDSRDRDVRDRRRDRRNRDDGDRNYSRNNRRNARHQSQYRDWLPSSDSESDEDQRPHRRNRDARNAEAARRNEIQCMKVLQNWKLSFSGEGNDNPVEFIEKLNDCKNCMRLEDEELLAALPCVFTRSAARWYRTLRPELRSWRDFRRSFRHQFVGEWSRGDLLDELRRRTQARGEKKSPYLTSFRQILSYIRRPPPADEVMDILIINLRPEYRDYMDGKLIETMGDVEKWGRRFERKQDLNSRYVDPPSKERSRIPSAAFHKPSTLPKIAEVENKPKEKNAPNLDSNVDVNPQGTKSKKKSISNQNKANEGASIKAVVQVPQTPQTTMPLTMLNPMAPVYTPPSSPPPVAWQMPTQFPTADQSAQNAWSEVIKRQKSPTTSKNVTFAPQAPNVKGTQRQTPSDIGNASSLNRGCRVCSQPGHLAYQCPMRSCHLCRAIGHFASECPSNQQCQGCGQRGATLMNCANCAHIKALLENTKAGAQSCPLSPANQGQGQR